MMIEKSLPSDFASFILLKSFVLAFRSSILQNVISFDTGSVSSWNLFHLALNLFQELSDWNCCFIFRWAARDFRNDSFISTEPPVFSSSNFIRKNDRLGFIL